MRTRQKNDDRPCHIAARTAADIGDEERGVQKRLLKKKKKKKKKQSTKNERVIRLRNEFVDVCVCDCRLDSQI